MHGFHARISNATANSNKDVKYSWSTKRAKVDLAAKPKQQQQMCELRCIMKTIENGAQCTYSRAANAKLIASFLCHKLLGITTINKTEQQQLLLTVETMKMVSFCIVAIYLIISNSNCWLPYSWQ